VKSERQVRVVVVGAGTAGCTAATLLAAAGLETVLVRSGTPARRPRVQTLSPAAVALLDRVGAHEELRARSAITVCEGVTLSSWDGSRATSLWFDEARRQTGNGYHVLSDDLDAVLLTRARRAGVEVLEGWQAVSPRWHEHRLVGVLLRDASDSELLLHSTVLLDATGRESFLAYAMGWRFPFQRRSRRTLFAHHQGVRAERAAAATALVLSGREGVWLTPLGDGSASVSAVLGARPEDARPADAVLAATTAACPAVAEALARARPTEPARVVENFPYRVMYIAGGGFCAIGDAAGFIDPAVVPGLLIALATGASAAQDIIETLGRRPNVERTDFAPTVTLTRALHRLYLTFVHALYDRNCQALLLSGRRFGPLRRSLAALVAGDVLRPDASWRHRATLLAWRMLGRTQALSLRLGRPLVPPVAPPGDGARPRQGASAP
jgi:flavin-dependent dehydrogenase